MLVKLGVDISKLKPPIRKKLTGLNLIIGGHLPYREEVVITSTYEGNHQPGSLHYAHLAIDIRRPENYRFKSQHIDALLVRLRNFLGSDYDVVLEDKHIHIEYDPEEV